MADEMLTDGQGQIRAMITYAGNPVSSIPQKGRLDEALAELDLYVAVDMYITETTRHADFILPPVSPLEREDVALLTTIFSVRNNIRYQHRSFEPAAGALEDWQILSRLDAASCCPTPLRQLAAPVREAVDRVRPIHCGSPRPRWPPDRTGGCDAAARASPCGQYARAPAVLDLGPLQPRLSKVLATSRSAGAPGAGGVRRRRPRPGSAARTEDPSGRPACSSSGDATCAATIPGCTTCRR